MYPSKDWGACRSLWGHSRKISCRQVQDLRSRSKRLNPRTCFPYDCYLTTKSTVPPEGSHIQDRDMLKGLMTALKPHQRLERTGMWRESLKLWSAAAARVICSNALYGTAGQASSARCQLEDIYWTPPAALSLQTNACTCVD